MNSAQFLARTTAWTCLAAASVAVGWAQPASAPQKPEQRPPVTFRSEINFVEIDAIVTDRTGRFVADLTKDDFEILEEGKRQAITTFTLVRIPVDRSLSTGLAREAPEPDVATNHEPFNGRLFLLLLDDLQTDFSRTEFVRKAAQEFVERHVSANDLVAVMHTSGRRHGQDFTMSRSRLLTAIHAFSGTKLQSKAVAMAADAAMTRDVLKTGSEGPPADPYELERTFRAKTSAESIERLSEFLAGIRGRRKSLIYFGEGLDHELVDTVTVNGPSLQRDTAGVREGMRRAVASATRANVSVYMIDPRGLSTGQEAAIGMATTLDPRAATGPMRLVDEMSRSHLWMRSVAEETGGIAFLNTSDLSGPLTRIVEDSSSHYILGYYAPAGRKDGRFRRVDVRVTRRGLEVRARKGYHAPGKDSAPRRKTDLKTSSELVAALDSPLPVEGLTFRASATPFKGSHPNASVALVVEIDPSKLAFTERGGWRTTEIELQVSAIDPLSKSSTHSSHHMAELRLSPQTYAAVHGEGVRITRRVDLRPGRYRLQLGVRDRTSGALGTLFTDVDVPDFAGPKLAMSGIVLVSAAATRIPTVQSDRTLTALLPGDHTARREFPANDTLAVFAEIYDNDLTRPHAVRVATSVRADDGREVFKASADHTSEELAVTAGGANQSSGFGHLVKIPASALGPGTYVLRVQAHRTVDEERVMREVPFTIR